MAGVSSLTSVRRRETTVSFGATEGVSNQTRVTRRSGHPADGILDW